jgi:hypothetical protein
MRPLKKLSLVVALVAATAAHADSYTMRVVIPGLRASPAPSTACPSSAYVFGYTGANQTVPVPAGCSSVTIKAWGAAGGSYSGINGGAGGYITAQYAVPSGTTLTVITGPGGEVRTSGNNATQNYTNTYYPGGEGGATSGGGLVGVENGATWLAVAGSGGGGYSTYLGGAGGGATGGQGSNFTAPYANGGTQTAGGQLSSCAFTNLCSGANGGFLTGGVANADQSGQGGQVTDAGGGGAGWYGGAGGSYWGTTSGGGGSSYFNSGAGYIGGGNTIAGSGTSVANPGDPDRGTAGVPNSGAAGNAGRVVLYFH